MVLLHRGFYSTLYHATSQWIMRSVTQSLILTQYEENRGFEIRNHVNYMYIPHSRLAVYFVYSILAC